MDNNVTVTFGATTVVVVFAHTVCKVIPATCVGIIHKVRKAVKAVKVNIATKVVAIKVVACLEFSKAVTAAQAAQIQQKAVHGFTNMVTWHSVYSLMEHVVTQTIALDQH